MKTIVASCVLILGVPLLVGIATDPPSGQMISQDYGRPRYSHRPPGCGACPMGVVPPLNTIRIFDKENFAGAWYDIDLATCGQGELQRLMGKPQLDDEMESLRWNLPRGVIVVFYDKAGSREKGDQYAIWGEGQDARLDDDGGFDDDASAWAWYRVGD